MRNIFKFFLALVPKPVIAFIRPGYKFPFKPYFIKVDDKIGGKPIHLFLREDSFMEKVIKDEGLYGNWEKESLRIWASLAKRCNCIIDIGSNTGIYSVLASNCNSNATVIAIEPIDLNYQILLLNKNRNKANIHVEKIALSNLDGVAKMFMLRDTINYMTSVNSNTYAHHPKWIEKHGLVEVQVPLKKFDYIVDKYNLKDINLIKIDVEGHEVPIIENMLPYLKLYMPSILIEIISDENAISLTEIFRGLGYNFISIDEINKSSVVQKITNLDHHNYLICNNQVVQYLKDQKLIEN